MLHGQNGFSVKSEAGQASYYYSQPFCRAAGTLTIVGEPVVVEGTAWLDREWSSRPLTGAQEGWDWLALRAGRHRPAARARRDRARAQRERRGGGARIPVGWHVAVPGAGVAVDIEPVNAQSCMGTTPPCWEGLVRLSGSDAGRDYLEMTGYE